MKNKSNLQAVWTSWNLKKDLLLEQLQKEEKKLLDHAKILQDLEGYSIEYMGRMDALNVAGIQLGEASLLARRSTLAMLGQVSQLISLQQGAYNEQKTTVSIAQESYLKGCLAIKNLEELIQKRQDTQEKMDNKRVEKRESDEFLARL